VRELGAAVIGLGVGEQHARAYTEIEDCVLRWVYDLDGARMVRIVKELGQGAPAESFETVLADRSVDVVSIASYDDAHFEQASRALHAGKHVFIEKLYKVMRSPLQRIRRLSPVSPEFVFGNLAKQWN